MTAQPPTPRQVAEAVAREFGVSADAIMANHRGHPQDAQHRWLAMHIWRTSQREEKLPTLTATGAAFGRDRTTVKHGLERLRSLWTSGRFPSERTKRVRASLR